MDAGGTYTSPRLRAPLNLKSVRGQKIHDDVVIISSIKSYIFPRFGDSTDNIQCLIAIERRNLDRDYIFDFRKLAPERIRKRPPPHRGLQIKTDDGKHFRDFSA